LVARRPPPRRKAEDAGERHIEQQPVEPVVRPERREQSLQVGPALQRDSASTNIARLPA
jgi:hypothetical protein